MADIDTLFESINSDVLTESVKIEMAVLFENAITEAVKQKETELEESYASKFITEKEDLINKLDMYLEAFCDEFVKNNTAVIEESAKVKTAEKVLNAFHTLVNEFHVTLDEKKIDSEDKLQEAQAQLNKVTVDLIKAKKETKLVEKAALISEASHKLGTDMEKAKLVEYGKKLPFDEFFEKKINAYAKTVLTEVKEKSKAKPIVEKIEIKEEKIIEEKVVTSVDQYLEKL